MIGKLLSLLWRLLSLVGLALSLRRWWRTLRDEEERKEVRALAGVILLGMGLLLIWSIVSLFGPTTAPATAALPTPAAPAASALVADFRDDLPLAAIDRFDDGLGVAFVPNSPVATAERLMVADVSHLGAAERQRLLATLRASDLVEAADENGYLSLLGAPAAFEPDDPRYGEQWNFRAIGMPQAWERSTGRGAVVAVIDTGVAFEPEGGVPVASDLRQTRWTKPYDFTKDKAKAYDDHGHGTHVAGTIAQSTNNRHGVAGIAFEATIMPLKVLTSGGYGTLSDIADAINYAADNGAHVINMSLGGPRGAAVLAKAVQHAKRQGVTIVCAAGNTASEGVCYPAAYPECVAVSAVGPSGELTFYSTWGKELAIAAPGGEYRTPEERPGGVLQNTVFLKKDAFEFWQGTSMASPHVAGVAALLVAQGIRDPDAVRRRLCETATAKDDPNRYGAGLLNAAAAVGASAGAAHRPPVGHAPAWLVGLAGAALWPFLATLLLFGVKPLRPVLGAGNLVLAVTALTLAFLGAPAGWWLVLNGLAAAVLGWLVLRPAR